VLGGTILRYRVDSVPENPSVPELCIGVAAFLDIRTCWHLRASSVEAGDAAVAVVCRDDVHESAGEPYKARTQFAVQEHCGIFVRSPDPVCSLDLVHSPDLVRVPDPVHSLDPVCIHELVHSPDHADEHDLLLQVAFAGTVAA